MNSLDHHHPLLPRPYSPPNVRPISLNAYHYGPARYSQPPQPCLKTLPSVGPHNNLPHPYGAGNPNNTSAPGLLGPVPVYGYASQPSPYYPSSYGSSPTNTLSPVRSQTQSPNHSNDNNNIINPPTPATVNQGISMLSHAASAVSLGQQHYLQTYPYGASANQLGGNYNGMAPTVTRVQPQYQHQYQHRPISPPDSTTSLSETEYRPASSVSSVSSSSSSSSSPANVMSISSLVSNESQNKRGLDEDNHDNRESMDAYPKRVRWHQYSPRPDDDNNNNNNRQYNNHSHNPVHNHPSPVSDAEMDHYHNHHNNHHSDHDHDGVKPHVCRKCQKGFLRLNDLIRHERSHKEVAQYYCPFYYDAYSGENDNDEIKLEQNVKSHNNDNSETSTSSLSPTKTQFCKCHQTGGFSRCDTFKNHLKSIHFVYPLGTKKKDRAGQSGVCKACDTKFDNVNAWLVKHVENNQCKGIVNHFN